MIHQENNYLLRESAEKRTLELVFHKNSARNSGVSDPDSIQVKVASNPSK